MQVGADERADWGHDFRSLASVAHRVSSVTHSCKLRPGLTRWATFPGARSARRWAVAVNPWTTERDSLRSSRHFGFSVQDLLKCHSLRMWISVIVTAAFTRVKRGGNAHGGYTSICMCVYKLFKVNARIPLRNAFLGSFMCPPGFQGKGR